MGNPGEHHLVPPGTSWFQAGTTWFHAGTSWFQVGTPWWYGENDKCQIFNKKKFPKFKDVICSSILKEFFPQHKQKYYFCRIHLSLEPLGSRVELISSRLELPGSRLELLGGMVKTTSVKFSTKKNSQNSRMLFVVRF